MTKIPALLFSIAISTGCASRTRTAPTVSVSMPLKAADYELLGWIEAEACANYVFGFRFPEKDPIEGRRRGLVSPGSIIGGNPPNADASDALYLAMVQMPQATHMLVPKYSFQSQGIGRYSWPIFGKQCAKVRVRGIALKG